MSLWGNKESFSNLTGTVTVNLSAETITGSGTTFVTAGFSTGDVITIGVGATYGQAVITGITSATLLSIGSTQFLIPLNGGISGAAYTVSQKPKFTLEDGQYFAPDVKSNRYSAVFGVNDIEATVAAGRTVGNKNAAYKVAHSGWVGVTTYVDTHGNFRVKSEVLVAGGISTTTDAADDSRFPNS
jgi:hypothetical protein